MKKIVRLFSLFFALFSICLLASCDLASMIPDMSGSNSSETGDLEFDTPEQLKQIYEMAVRQGYDGSYEDWMEELKGDQVEIRAENGYIQWRYAGSSKWQNIIALSELAGESGNDGLTPYIGTNGNWWVGTQDTGVSASGSGDGTGEAGKSAYELYIELHPEYTGDEEQWLSDLINGLLSEENYKYYNVTFDDGCGNKNDISVLAKHPLDKPEDPKRVGYIFVGWYSDGEEWNFNANVVLKDLTLQAKWVRASIQPSVNISYIYADKTNVYFELEKDDLSEIKAITIYKGGHLVQTLSNLKERQFSNLLSNNEYRVEVTYSYDINDGFGEQTKTTSSYVTTSHKKTPDVQLRNVEVTWNSIDFEMDIFDEDNVAVFKKAELYDGKELVETITNKDELSFNNLYSNRKYSGKVYYEYDFNDGKKVKEYCFEFSATTSPIYQPVATLNNVSATQNQITAEVVISDASKVDELISISLYKGDELIQTGTDLILNYTGLNTNTVYTIVVEHKYDLNDGNGEIIVTDKFDVSTHPVYQLFDTEILNTSAILEGETVFIHATINNPSEATFKYIFIDGNQYTVNPSSNSKNVLVEIPAVNVGDTTFTINKLVAELNGIEFEYYAEEENTVTATLYEKLEVESIEFVDYNMEPTDYYFDTANYYMKVNLNNPVGYSLDSVTIGSYSYYLNEELFKIDDETYYVDLYSMQYNVYELYYLTLTSFTYSNELIERMSTDSVKSNLVVLVKDSTPYLISSVDDLLSIGNDKYTSRYYELTNDIDLSGMEWDPIDYLAGVFNGNGYSIKNLRISKTFNNTNAKIGLFAEANGLIKDLTLEEMIIMIDLTRDDTNHYQSFIGGFVGHSHEVIFDNCHIDNLSSISVTNVNTNDVDVAGLTPSGKSVVKNSSNRANIYGKKVSTVSAFAYYAESIKNSYNTGNVTSVYYQDGSYGYIDNILAWDCSNIVNSYNTGAANGQYSNAYRMYSGNYHSLLGESQYFKDSVSIGEKYPNKVLNWDVKTYSFDTNGGDVIPSVDCVVLSELPTPTKDGYMFAGWYDNKALNGERLLYAYSEEDMTLYAKWYEIIDHTQLAVNDPNHPFIEQDGVLISGDLSDGGYNATYKLVADRKIRVSFNYSSDISGGYYNVNAYSSSGMSLTVIPDDDLQLSFYELDAGGYIQFSVHSYGSNFSGNLRISNLLVLGN